MPCADLVQAPPATGVVQPDTTVSAAPAAGEAEPGGAPVALVQVEGIGPEVTEVLTEAGIDYRRAAGGNGRGPAPRAALARWPALPIHGPESRPERARRLLVPAPGGDANANANRNAAKDNVSQ